MILNSAKRELLEAELLAAEGLAPKGRSLSGDAMRRLLRNKAAALSLIVLALLVLIAIVGPSLLPFNYEDPDWNSFRGAPDFAAGHYFGTDGNGRDLLARTLYGTRVSLTVALVATLVSVVIGVLYGAVSGYFGGRVDAIMMRFVDIMYALPYVLFVILLMVIFGRNVYLLFAAIGALEWLTMARIVRGQTLSIKQRELSRRRGLRPASVQDHPQAHRSEPRRASRHLCNAHHPRDHRHGEFSFLSRLWRAGTADFARHTDRRGSAGMETTPWLLFFPAGFLVALLMSLLFIGDGLRDAFDPKDR